MSASESTRLQVNFKTRAGTLINLYADNPDQLDSELDALTTRIGTILDIESSLGGPPVTTAEAAVTRAFPGSQQVTSTAPQQAAGDAPQCPHGERVFRSGNGARGPWSAWMCPAPKGTPGQCQPQWIK